MYDGNGGHCKNDRIIVKIAKNNGGDKTSEVFSAYATP